MNKILSFGTVSINYCEVGDKTDPWFDSYYTVDVCCGDETVATMTFSTEEEALACFNSIDDSFDVEAARAASAARFAEFEAILDEFPTDDDYSIEE